ncbi:heat shock protein transcriptional repressor HspR [Kytococcus sedentarius]|uniref:heat shock protein transcriptional repressor HspR n=1 Tax=Kytococcus sedentarius TaxID=1276 RepID=UPI00384DB7D1
MSRSPDTRPVYVISVAAELTGMHAQTLRQYDRMGLVSPSRARGGGRRYSEADVERLREVQRLSSSEGVSLEGIRRILELTRSNEEMEARLAELDAEVQRLRTVLEAGQRVFAAGRSGTVEPVAPGRRPGRRPSAGELVLWRPGRQG